MAPGAVVKRRSAIGAATPKSARRRWGGRRRGPQQQVGRLDVAVHQAGGVDRGERVQQLLDQHGDRAGGERAVPRTRSASVPPRTSSIASTTRRPRRTSRGGRPRGGAARRGGRSRTSGQAARAVAAEHLERDVLPECGGRGRGGPSPPAGDRAGRAAGRRPATTVGARPGAEGGEWTATQQTHRETLGRLAVGLAPAVLHRIGEPSCAPLLNQLSLMSAERPDVAPRRTHNPSCHG